MGRSSDCNEQTPSHAEGDFFSPNFPLEEHQAGMVWFYEGCRAQSLAMSSPAEICFGVA